MPGVEKQDTTTEEVTIEQSVPEESEAELKDDEQGDHTFDNMATHEEHDWPVETENGPVFPHEVTEDQGGLVKNP